MKKDTPFVNQLPVNDFKRGLSVSIIDGSNFTKAGSPQVVFIQPTSQPKPATATQPLPTSSNGIPTKPEK